MMYILLTLLMLPCISIQISLNDDIHTINFVDVALYFRLRQQLIIDIMFILQLIIHTLKTVKH